MSTFNISRKSVQHIMELEMLQDTDTESKRAFLSQDTRYPDATQPRSQQKRTASRSDQDEAKVHDPKGPLVLTRRSLSWHSILMDIFVVVSTFPFVALVVIVARLNGQVVDQEQWRLVENATRVSATLFPIVFAATVGRLVTKAASWKLARGSKLGLLEQLMSSRTVFATLSTQVSLGSFNVLGVCLVLLWVLSPLGGQSSLRIIRTGPRSSLTQFPIVYFNTDATSNFVNMIATSPASSGAVEDSFVVLNALYNAALLAPVSTKLGNVDLWNNVKIPYLSSFDQHPSARWTDIPLKSSDIVPVYSSLIGIPVFDIPLGNSSFLLESSYMELNCDNMTSGPVVQFTNATALRNIFGCQYQEEPCSYTVPNGTFQGEDFMNRASMNTSYLDRATWALAIDNFVNYNFWGGKGFTESGDLMSPSNLTDQVNIEADQATLLFQSANVQPQMYRLGSSDVNYTAVYCKVNQKYVESRVNCSQAVTSTKACAVVAQRMSQLPHTSDVITQLSWARIFFAITRRLPRANQATGNDGLSDLSLYHIQNATRHVTGQRGYADYENTTMRAFSEGLGQVLNSYTLLGQTSILVTKSTYEKDDPLLLVTDGIPRNQTTLADVTTLDEIYIMSQTWLGIFAFSIAVLLLAAISSVVLSHLTTYPEILGSCSLLVRDSKYIDLAVGRGTLDGIDLTKALKNLEVRAGEVERNSDGAGILGVNLRERVSRAQAGKRYY